MPTTKARRLCKGLVLIWLAGVLLGGINSSGAIAAPPVFKEQNTEEANAAAAFMRGILHEDVKIIREFPAPLDLTGYVIQVPQGETPLKPPSYAVVYMDAKHTHLLAGVGIFDAVGENSSRTALSEYAPPTDYSAALKATEASAYFAEGKAGAPVVYAFFDANCIFCNRLWLETRDFVNTGQVQLRWVPVGIIKKDSEDKGAGILSSSDPVAALTQDEVAFDTKNEEGGLKVTHDKLSANTFAEVQANDKLMRLAGFYGTPTLLYVTKTGQAIAKQGMPSKDDWKLIFAQLK